MPITETWNEIEPSKAKGKIVESVEVSRWQASIYFTDKTVITIGAGEGNGLEVNPDEIE